MSGDITVIEIRAVPTTKVQQDIEMGADDPWRVENVGADPIRVTGSWAIGATDFYSVPPGGVLTYLPDGWVDWRPGRVARLGRAGP